MSLKSICVMSFGLDSVYDSVYTYGYRYDRTLLKY